MDLSYFEEPVQVLDTVAQYDLEGALVAPAVYRTEQLTRKRPQSVSHADLNRIIEKHKGGNPVILDKMIGLHVGSVQWDWFDRYQDYLVASELVASQNLAITESNTDKLVEEQVALVDTPKAPVRPFMGTVAGWRERNYGLIRGFAYLPVEKQLEMLYDDQVNATTRFRAHVDAVKLAHPKPVVV